MGVLSVYLDVDRADRGRGWRIALVHRLRALRDTVSDHERRKAFDEVTGRVLSYFPEEGPPPPGRTHIGFLELGAGAGDVWRSMQVRSRGVQVVLSSRPRVGPLIEIFDQAPYAGIVAVSSERVRVLEWSLGTVKPLHDWEMVIWAQDWRERKAERSV